MDFLSTRGKVLVIAAVALLVNMFNSHLPDLLIAGVSLLSYLYIGTRQPHVFHVLGKIVFQALEGS